MADLYGIEDSMKSKYLPLIRNLSHVELKKFNKSDYKKKVLRDMAKLCPGYDTSVLDGYAQCVSNALQREAQCLLRNRMRPTSACDTNEPLELSDTILEALDLTMGSDVSTATLPQVLIDDDSNEGNGDGNSDDEVTDADATDADDSITLLKQTVDAESSTDSHAAESAVSTSEPHKCCETCAVNPKSKKKLAMIQCNVCMSWFHEQCVGIDKNSDPIGIWLCVTCRAFPKLVTAELSVMRNELNGLKQSTSSILAAVQNLTSNIERSIGNINDRLTAINKQISTNDKGISGALQNLNTTTSNIKTSVEQKTSQILNKTGAVLDKVKSAQTDITKQIKDTSRETCASKVNRQYDNTQQVPLTQSEPLNPRQGKKAAASENTHECHKQQSQKQQTNKEQTGHTKQKPTNDAAVENQETIDLTVNSKPVKTIKHATLLTGSSLLKNVNSNQLNANTTVRSFPGATIDSLKSKLSEYNLDQCKTVLLFVGGNDADNGTDIETFAEKYETLITDLMTHDRRVIVVGLLPRTTVDLNPFNDRLKTLCEAYGVEFIDNYKSFLLASGEIPDSYFQSDKVHLNNFGLRRLLTNVDRAHPIVSKRPAQSADRQSNATQSGIHRPKGARGYARGSPFATKFCHICSKNGHETRECRSNVSREHVRVRHHVPNFCYICSRSGHDTLDCWFNGRSNGRSDTKSR